MEQKPVVILGGMDHSDFCPGFQVPGDVYPSDITDKTVSNNLIGEFSSAFLHLHTEQSDDTKKASIKTLKDQAQWTRNDLMKSYILSLELEGSIDNAEAPWCSRI